jgi:hypothetical protein
VDEDAVAVGVLVGQADVDRALVAMEQVERAGGLVAQNSIIKCEHRREGATVGVEHRRADRVYAAVHAMQPPGAERRLDRRARESDRDEAEEIVHTYPRPRTPVIRPTSNTSARSSVHSYRNRLLALTEFYHRPERAALHRRPRPASTRTTP